MFLMRLATFLNGLRPLEDGEGDGTSATDRTDDESINQVLDNLEKIVNKTIMPIIYAVLGLFLVVKGAMLGMQIVKAADEPQVRQEKIGALKWLIIGVAIAFAVAGLAQVVINYLGGMDLAGSN